MQGRMTKTKQVKTHLRTHGHIDTWTAIQEYGATRLSAIIFELRKNGWDIETEDITTRDRNGNPSTYANYIYHGEKVEE
jgi:hypothetical protein